MSTAARTAVIVGTASAVSGKAASNQAAKAQQAASQSAVQPQPDVAPSAPAAPTPASPVAVSDDLFEQLKKLGELRDSGILTDAEFQAKKTQLLGI